MKKINSLILLLFLSVFVLTAQKTTINISGHVTDVNGGSPVANHLVYIYADSSSNPNYTYFNTLITDINGYYSDSIQVPTGFQILFNVFTFDCNNDIHNQYLVSTNTILIADFQICASGSGSCNALFSFVPDTTDPFTFSFVDLSTGNPNLWQWDFGDGTFSSSQNSVHTYGNVGAYQVCLTIINTDSMNYCTDIFCDVVVIDSTGGCFANFYANSTPSNPLAFHFIDMSSPNINQWYWDFGDGSASTDHNPFHTYADTGAYNVCLTVMKGMPGTMGYCEDTYCEQVYATGLPPPCHADYNIIPNPTDPFTMTFSNISTGNFNKVYWDFGDGSFSHKFSPEHTFSSPGVYNVCLSVYQVGGGGNADTLCEDTYCEIITVPPPNYYNLAGQVLANFFPTDFCRISLYRNMNNGQYLLFDTTSINMNGVYYFYQLPYGEYLIKASPVLNSPVFGQSLPTYYGNTIHWFNANTINLNHDIFNANVELIPYQFFGYGSGNISGKISFKGGNNQPAENIEVLLLDAQNIPVKVDYSAHNGFFEFSDLPFGTYQVFPEVAGKNTNPVTVTIDNNSSVVNNVFMVITENAVIASLDDNLPENIESISDVFPNPSNDKVYLDLDLSRTSRIEFRIIDHIGQMISDIEYSLNTGENRIETDVSHYVNGLYIIQVINDDNAVLTRRFIKID